MDRLFYISPSPHIKDSDSIPHIMYWVLGALIPAGIGSVVIFGSRVLWIIAIAVAVSVMTEWICQLIMKRPVRALDGSAIITGILVAYNVPAEVSWWIPAVGAFVGITLGKMVFGGLGFNPMNPALIGRAFLTASWPLQMTVFQTLPANGTLSGINLEGIDALTSATPLNMFSQVREILLNVSQYSDRIEYITQAQVAETRLYDSTMNLLLGKIGGCIGETSVVLLLFGAAILMYKRIIGWKIPFFFVGTVAVFTWLFGGTRGIGTGNPLFHILSGGLILGAFFMATDMVTSPVTFRGRIFFGIGCGLLTSVIRLWGGYPEGVSYSILLMNLATPLLDRATLPKKFGGQ